jgi:hypothetical protein
MKIIRLLFAGILLLTGTSGFAQDCHFTTNSFTITGPNNQLMTQHNYIVNTGGGSYDLKVKRMVNKMCSPTHSSYFCFYTATYGNCYPPSTSLTPRFTINPGDIDTLIADLSPGNVDGNDTVVFALVDADDTSIVYNTVTYYFSAIGVGIEEVAGTAHAISNAYPNPANMSTRVAYTADSKDAKLEICNLLGARVKEIALRDKEGVAIIPTDDLKNGIYLYNLVQNGKAIESKKLIVNHF